MSVSPSAPVTESYHAQHSPFGAFASFSIGLVDNPGGFGHALKGAARQNVYIGFKTGTKAKWQMLPYFTPPKSNEVAFTGEAANAQPPSNFHSLRPSEFKRHLGWASDTWTVDGFSFALYSAFDQVPDPAKMSKALARRHLAPVIVGEISFDNRKGKEDAQLIFGLGEPDRGIHPLTDTTEGLAGFACGNEFGYATPASKSVEMRQGFDVFAPKFRDYRGLLVIGAESALVFTVPAGKKKTFPLILGFYNEGVISSGLPASYAYTRWFKNLEDVLHHGNSAFSQLVALSGKRDKELAKSKLNDDQKFLIAQATHSYLGSTQLLWHKGKPLWVVNEGEYRMINTFDLTVDHVFHELHWTPWAVRDTLDLFASRFAYTDDIKVSGKRVRGGIAFTHDMGVMNHFTPKGHSSYEVDNIEGCFSHMTMEQLLNWILTAATYAAKTGDKAWLRKNAKTLQACAESLQRRDDPEPSKRNGIPKHDSARCGDHGAEITTYDSLDVSLGQARNNLYLSVKALGAWVLLEKAWKTLGRKAEEIEARTAAERLAQSLTERFESETGFFPAVFENGNRSRILPAVEGFVYPHYLGYTDATDRKGRFAKLLAQLSQHMSQALEPGVCIDNASGGWKMSSTSKNTWFSKIAIAQHVVRTLFPETLNERAGRADKVHADWQRTPGCGTHAMCDQIWSDTGVTCGSRYYPRGVTSFLWLSE